MRWPAVSECVSIDIGSTFTKGARFRFPPEGMKEPKPEVIHRADRATNRNDLTISFNEVLGELTSRAGEKLPVHVSSSAKGGLSVAAVGIVPDLTLKAARLTACSAGAKIIKTYAYRLTDDELAELTALRPDIILLTGGTDGGDEDYVLHNSAMLAGSGTDAVILYAGNAKAAARVERNLSGKQVRVVSNVLPEINRINPGPAQDAIRRIFLQEIIKGKGLTDVQSRAAGPIKPTPLAVFELVRVMAGDDPWKDSMIVDPGGATTDCYSNSEAAAPETGSVTFRGLPEPRIKRSVEGDLGVRLSLRTLFASAGGRIEARAAKVGIGTEEVSAYIEKVSSGISRLPGTEQEEELDRIFASACFALAVRRHAGTMRTVYGPLGEQFVQTGKDLRRVRRVIITGGVLSRYGLLINFPGSWESDGNSGAGNGVETVTLVPRTFELYRDSGYILPLLANLAEPYPNAVLTLLKECLIKEDTVRCA
ncbi:MAG: glutamate mutase L [Spirochaetia bacterium]